MAAIPNVDWGTSGRVDEYECWLVDPFSLVGLSRVDFDADSSSVTYAIDTDTKQSATVAVLDDLAKDSMVRIKHTVEIGGEKYGEEMGTFFASSKSMTAKHGRTSRSMDCYSTLLRQQKDYLMSVHSYAPGDNVSQIIKEIVEADGGHVVFGADAPTDRLHTQDVHWEIGTNKLEIITKLAGWIGGEIGVTDHGEVELDASVSPLEKPLAWTFVSGSNCVYVPGFTSSEDEGDYYNRAIFYYSTDEATGSATAVLDPTHPYSYERIGRNVTYTEELNEVVPQDELTAKASDFLALHSGGSVYYEIEHAGIPGLRPGMVVRYVNDDDYSSRVDSLCLVTEMSVDSLGPMCATRTKMRALT